MKPVLVGCAAGVLVGVALVWLAGKLLDRAVDLLGDF